MEPRIQYAQTKDGVSIAFWTMGKGAALVQMRSGLSLFRMEWEVPEFRTFNERLAQKRMLVQYDDRGTGLSERGVTDFSLDALALDLQAVVDCLGLERFALYGAIAMGPVAVACAARYHERVSHLILWCTAARGSDRLGSPQIQALRQLSGNWELFTDTLAHYFFGWPGGEAARQWAAMLRQGVTQETFQAFQRQLNRVDVTDLLLRVSTPTLVLHRRQLPWLSVDAATYLASRIPNARLVILEGESAGIALEDSQAVLDVIDEFLGEGEEVASEAEPPDPERDAARLEALFLPPEPTPAAYVCLGATCSAPVTDPAALTETIEKMRSADIQTLE